MGDLRFAPAKEGTNSENERLLPVPTSSSPLTSDAASSQGHSEGIPLIKEPLSPSNKASGQRQSADQGTAAAASGTAVVVPAGKTSSSGASILASVPSEGGPILSKHTSGIDHQHCMRRLPGGHVYDPTALPQV